MTVPKNRRHTGMPHRAVEADYLRVLHEACSLDDWSQIIQKTVEDAKAGDSKARAFLASWLMKEAPSLTKVHVDKVIGRDNVTEAVELAKELQELDEHFKLSLSFKSSD